ncbi:hypothetical protein [Leuconostoc pseudomesenteroides]|uniref:hypothetical protein n=1 Tax=Leuconostoc pseudomesenteroides TaxID=33968 RepID=UPI00228540DA|nr:hypothetical protein [Leuconostoc pseudomesenteroides]WAM39512.1 hypothetical protein OYT93_04825 [Leuconostoc pseudomesenteroides]
MENKHTHIYFFFLAVLVIIASVLLIKSGTGTRETKKDISSSFVSISSAESSMSENSTKHSTDMRHVFSVPRGSDMMQGNNSSNVFFTTWTLADFESWIANYKKMSYLDKAQSTSTFATSYTFENLKINDNQNDASLTFDTFVQEHWFYFDTVSDFIEKNDKNADPNSIQ